MAPYCSSSYTLSSISLYTNINYNMAKKSKKIEAVFTASGKTIKEGDEILYISGYTVDKTSVERVVKEDKLKKTPGYAVLANQIRVKTEISTEGYLKRVDGFNTNCNIRVWSEQAELEYNYFLAKISLKNNCNELIKAINNMGKESLIKVDEKVKRLIQKYV
jgi:hypothetical protein